MITILKNIASRAKKLAVFLLLVPVLTAGIAYYLESKSPTTFASNATVELGNFENERLTDTKTVEKLVRSTSYLQEIIKENHADLNVNNVRNKLTVTSVEKNIVQFRYVASTEKEANDTLEMIVDKFESDGHKLFKEKKDLIEEKINTTKSINSQYEDVKKQEVLYDLQMTLTNMRDTQILEPVRVVGAYNNPMKRAIFGLLVGIMLDCAVLVMPELFREYK